MTAQTLTPTIPTAAIDRLEGALRGRIVRPHDPDYDEARAVYNGMIDKRPAVVARCVDVADVIATVEVAREHGIPLAIRGGGHNGPGLGSVDDGIVLDLSPMKGIRIDPIARTARVEGGCTWGEVDHATHAFGLAVPSGVISTTGVGGLTLGGGLGHLSRKHGLTIDNLLAADLVLADGSFVTASEDEHPDLFWAIRGGGGNFGIVTSFLFRLHPVDTVVAGPTLWPIEQADEVMRWYRDFITQAPEDLNGFFAFLKVPPAPPFPEELHTKTMCGIVWCYTGPADKADAVFAPVLEVGTPALHGVQPMPYPALQSAFDALYPPGMQWYWKADFVRELPDEAIARHVEHGSRLPSLFSTMHLYPINGKVHRRQSGDTAFSYRDVTWGEVIVGVDPDPANAEAITSWARDYWEAVHPYAAGGAYVNMMMNEGQDRIRASYGDNYDRLAEIKARYDPTNLFRVNQNIAPAPTGSAR
jgi:FAD/FMN-containing dehydrogenase